YAAVSVVRHASDSAAYQHHQCNRAHCDEVEDIQPVEHDQQNENGSHRSGSFFDQVQIHHMIFSEISASPPWSSPSTKPSAYPNDSTIGSRSAAVKFKSTCPPAVS